MQSVSQEGFRRSELGKIYSRNIGGHPTTIRTLEQSGDRGFLLVLATTDYVWAFTGWADQGSSIDEHAALFGDMPASIRFG